MKKLLRWGFMGVLVFGFVGCGGGSTPSNTKPTGINSTKPTETNSTKPTETNSTKPINTNTKLTETNSTKPINTNTKPTETNSTKINKIAPIFTSSSSISVNENQTTALILTATDVDTNTSELSYSISGGDSADFTMTNGVITFKVAPNYESKKSYSFTATVSDGVNESNQSVSIAINNIAEIAPRLGADLNLSIAENTVIASTLGSISIVNIGDTAISSFEINGTDSSIISISTDGTISLKKVLNYEIKTYYEFNITAINKAGRSNTMSLELNITDINETSITLAVYDDNHTSTATDDTLRVYFSKDIDTNTRSNTSANNYAIDGTGDISTATGIYNSTYKEDKITSIDIALIPYESNISIVANSITDINGTQAETLSSRVISAYAIKKTGQTLSYEANGSIHSNGTQKDDGYYQSGISPRYSRDDSKELVLDQITGLMWVDDANVSTVTKQWVTTANYNAGDYNNTSGDTATTYCSNLTLGGYSDWRLPTSLELESIVDYGRYNPSINPIFKNTSSNFYWSSTSAKSPIDYAWIVDFNLGSVGGNLKNGSTYVRCVRGGE